MHSRGGVMSGELPFPPVYTFSFTSVPYLFRTRRLDRPITDYDRLIDRSSDLTDQLTDSAVNRDTDYAITCTLPRR